MNEPTYIELIDLVSSLSDQVDGVDEVTCGSAVAFARLLEMTGAACPRVFWHGGDAVVFTWNDYGPAENRHMVTITDDSFHVHFPRPLINKDERE